MEPSLRLRALRISPWLPTTSSVEPPPMSHTTTLRSNTGTAWSTPRWMRRASSNPEITSTSTPTSRARSMNTARFSASRTAEVATARMVAPWIAATCRKRASASMPRVIAAGVSRFMSPADDPRRTISFSRSTHLDAVLVDPGDDEVDRVRADVDRGEDVGHALHSDVSAARSRRSPPDRTD